MINTLMEEIEDVLEVYARNPDRLFDLAEKMSDSDGLANCDLSEDEYKVLGICLNFTVGSLAGYIQEIKQL